MRLFTLQLAFYPPDFAIFSHMKSQKLTHIKYSCELVMDVLGNWDILHTHNYCIAYWPPKWNLKGGQPLCNSSRGSGCMEGKVCIKEYSPSFGLYWELCTIQAVWSTCKRSQEIKQLLRQDQVPLAPFYCRCRGVLQQVLSTWQATFHICNMFKDL